MKHYYFVSYKSDIGHGRIEVSMKSKISKISQLESIEKFIKKEYGTTAVILNFILLRRSRA